MPTLKELTNHIEECQTLRQNDIAENEHHAKQYFLLTKDELNQLMVKTREMYQ